MREIIASFCSASTEGIGVEPEVRSHIYRCFKRSGNNEQRERSTKINAGPRHHPRRPACLETPVGSQQGRKLPPDPIAGKLNSNCRGNQHSRKCNSEVTSKLPTRKTKDHH